MSTPIIPSIISSVVPTAIDKITSYIVSDSITDTSKIAPTCEYGGCIVATQVGVQYCPFFSINKAIQLNGKIGIVQLPKRITVNNCKDQQQRRQYKK